MSIQDKVPSFLLGKNQLIMTVTFTALFSVVFLLLSIPFSGNVWFQIGASEAFCYTLAFFLLSVGVVVLSKMQLYRMRFATDFTFVQLTLWELGEILVISLMYTFFTIMGGVYGIIDIKLGFIEIFFPAFAYVLVSLGVPCVIAGQYFAINEKNNTIRLMNMSSVAGDVGPGEDMRVTLYDNSGILKFSSTLSHLFYIESDDNYIQVWYSDKDGQIRQYMLRCRLKTVEESFAGSDLVRCHRKYIVNMSKVSVLKAEKDGYYIDLDIDSLDPIPVSKTYEEAVLARFNSR